MDTRVETCTSRTTWWDSLRKLRVAVFVAVAACLFVVFCSGDETTDTRTLAVSVEEVMVEFDVNAEEGSVGVFAQAVAIEGQAHFDMWVEALDGTMLALTSISVPAEQAGNPRDGATGYANQIVELSDEVVYVDLPFNWSGSRPDAGWNWVFDFRTGPDITSISVPPFVVPGGEAPITVEATSADTEPADLVVAASLGDGAEVTLEWNADRGLYYGILPVPLYDGANLLLWVSATGRDGGLTLFEKGLGSTKKNTENIEATLFELATMPFITPGEDFTWEEDWDADGVSDHFYTDSGDFTSFPEYAYVDEDGDGITELFWVNLDFDDDFDVRFNDTNADGVYDEGHLDFNGALFSKWWVDVNGDGKFSMDEVFDGEGHGPPLVPGHDPRRLPPIPEELLHPDQFLPCGQGEQSRYKSWGIAVPPITKDSNGNANQGYVRYPGTGPGTALDTAVDLIGAEARFAVRHIKCNSTCDDGQTCERDDDIDPAHIRGQLELDGACLPYVPADVSPTGGYMMCRATVTPGVQCNCVAPPEGE